MDELNRQFEERYLLVLSDEEKLYESIIGITKEFTEGKIPMDLYVKSLDIANATVQEIHSKRSVLHKLIQQIRYHLFKMKEFIEINYEDGLHFIVVPNQTYVKLHNEFLARSHYFLKEWNEYEKEHGLCLPDTRTEIRSFELVFKMINLITDEYDAHVYPDQKLLHIYTLARELPGLLLDARDLALDMDPKIIADQYFMKKYLNKPTPYTSRNYRMNDCPDFEYVREPGMSTNTRFTNNFGIEKRRHIDSVLEYQRHQQMTGDIGRTTTPPGPKLQRPNIRGGVYPGTISEQPTIENAGKHMVRSGSDQPVYPGRPELRQEPSEETTRKS